MQNSLLIIDKTQFGYLTDSHKWCEYLRDEYHITYLCYDFGRKKMPIDGVEVKYLTLGKIRALRFFRWFIFCLWHIMLHKGVTIVIYHKKCDIWKRIMPHKKMIVDIRTLSVDSSLNARTRYDNDVRNSAKYFDAITIISAGLSQKLGDVGKPKFILPLGSDVISHEPKTLDSLRLLYVGTFTNRDLHKTLEGLRIWINSHPNCKISYDIIGDGNGTELDELMTYSRQLCLDQYVTFHGRLPHDELKRFFDKCNIGVSFVPITDYFQYQPPTKTYEYILSGLYTIATNTKSNYEIINHENGLLINDTSEDFANALSYTEQHLTQISDIKIRNSLQESTWDTLVKRCFIPIIKRFI